MANQKFQNALSATPQSVPPIWFMRQAGRYHDHYQALRAKHSFIELCKNADLAAEVALGPIDEFDFDISILFSDLLFPLEALGMGLDYNPGPQLEFQLDQKSLSSLKTVDEAIGALEFQYHAVAETRKRLPDSKSLIGFVGGPWTLFGYAVEGSHKGGLVEAKRSIDLYRPFCELMVPLLVKNIQLQLDGGAEAVMVLDTASGELSPKVFNELIVPTINALAARFPKQLGYYSKGTTLDHLDSQVLSHDAWAGFGFDHRWDITERLKERRFGFVQGNFDQTMLFQDRALFKQSVERFLAPLREMGPEDRRGWVCGVGHGVLPKTPMENVKYFVQHVREVFHG